MRATLLFTLSLACAGSAWAQAALPVPAARAPLEQRTERIHIEDAGARIEELRVGGETRAIEVQPKGGMPAYQIAPASGERSWKILGF